MTAPEIRFRPVTEADFPLMTRWLSEPHVRRFYQAEPVTSDDVAQEYGAAVRGEEPTRCDLAVLDGRPFAYFQAYRNADYPEWVEILGRTDGTSVDLYIGEPDCVGRGLGRAALRAYVSDVVFPAWPEEACVYIAHERGNAAALACSRAAGFEPDGAFLEDGKDTVRLRRRRP